MIPVQVLSLDSDQRQGVDEMEPISIGAPQRFGRTLITLLHIVVCLFYTHSMNSPELAKFGFGP